MSVSEDAGPFPRQLVRITKKLIIRVWKPLPSKHVLKTLRGSQKEKVQRGEYRLAVGLNRYTYTKLFNIFGFFTTYMLNNSNY